MATFAPPPGTADIFADEARRWRNLENTAAAVFSVQRMCIPWPISPIHSAPIFFETLEKNR